MAVTRDRLGAALGTFCALTPLEDEAGARAALAGWDPSPFARLEHVHFARMVVLPRPQRQAAAQPAEEAGPPLLMFSAFADGEPAALLEEICERLPGEADAVWRCCAGYPGHPARHGHAFRAWLERHRVPATQVFGAYPDATVADVRAALAFRERLRAFAFGLEERRRGHAAAFAAFDAELGR